MVRMRSYLSATGMNDIGRISSPPVSLMRSSASTRGVPAARGISIGTMGW